MSPRVQQLERTRAAIVEAASELLMSGSDPAGFTMQAVADRAGVSHRTLYRHFADRQALINAVGSAWDEQLEAGMDGFAQPSEFDEWTANASLLVTFGVANREMLRRASTASLAGEVWRTDRDERYWKLFRDRFPNLPEAEARQDFAILRHVLGSANVLLVGERFALAPRDLALGMQRAANTLIESIVKRDAAAAEGSGR